MAKQIDLTEVQQLIEQGQQADALKKRLKDQVEKVQKAQAQLTDQLQSLASLLGEAAKPARRGRPRSTGENRPKPGSAPEKLCKAMSSSKPMQVSEIAKKTDLSEGTVKQYLHKFDCFYSAGRGKGYLCKPSGEPGPAAGPTGERLTPGQRKAKKAKKKSPRKSSKKTAHK